MSMLNFEIDNSALSRKVVRAVCDLAHRPPSGLRVLDLASAHGHYSVEMAKLGAQVLGIEGRESWLEQARRTKLERDWPENLDGYLFERYIIEQQARGEKTAGRRDRVRRFLRGTRGRVRRSLRKKSQG